MTEAVGSDRAPAPRVGPRRRRELRRGAAVAAARWNAARRQAAEDAAIAKAVARPEVLTDLPRRPALELPPPAANPALRSRLDFRAGFFATLRRCLAWLAAALVFLAGNVLDRLRRRASPERRAARLRRTFQRLGGTSLKLGQQMALRVDLLPMVYCLELSELLDRLPPFPTERAIEIIEASTGRPLDETFAAFDPEPIGSASISCVYQAVLHDGRRVAVKVRRPGVVRTYAADLRALSWLVSLAELLTLARPGPLRSLVHDLETMFEEELDFHKEARYTDLFRRRVRRSELRSVTAPRVFFEHSSRRVLVTEFVSGLWMGELLAAVESRDPEGMALVESLEIDPREVGRRLFRASLFGIFESHVFHADPHPANVVVRRGGEIVLIDFGSCGSFTETQVAVMRQFHYHQAQENISGMVQCVLTLLEPLPPVDIDSLTQKAEQVFSDSLRALRSGNCEWWERTSAGVWLGFMRLARQYHITVRLDTLRLIRATLLYDTLAARLDPDLDIYREYRSYRRQVAVAARQRFRGRMNALMSRGLDDRVFLRMEELADLGSRVAYRLQRFADSPSYKFSLLAGKAGFAASTLLRWAGLSASVGALAVGVLAALRWMRGEPLNAEVVSTVATHGLFLGFAGLALAFNLRRILFRFGDKEV